MDCPDNNKNVQLAHQTHLVKVIVRRSFALPQSVVSFSGTLHLLAYCYLLSSSGRRRLGGVRSNQTLLILGLSNASACPIRSHRNHSHRSTRYDIQLGCNSPQRRNSTPALSSIDTHDLVRFPHTLRIYKNNKPDNKHSSTRCAACSSRRAFAAVLPRPPGPTSICVRSPDPTTRCEVACPIVARRNSCGWVARVDCVGRMRGSGARWRDGGR
jgi:hypothetical protein